MNSPCSIIINIFTKYLLCKISTLEQSDNPQDTSKIFGLVDGHDLLPTFYYEKFQICRKRNTTMNIHIHTVHVQSCKHFCHICFNYMYIFTTK